MDSSYISSTIYWNRWCLSVADDEEDTEAGERDADVEEALGEQQQSASRDG